MAFCFNDLDNFIGPIDQRNIIVGDTPEDSHVNNFEASQIALDSTIVTKQVLGIMMQTALIMTIPLILLRM